MFILEKKKVHLLITCIFIFTLIFSFSNNGFGYEPEIHDFEGETVTWISPWGRDVWLDEESEMYPRIKEVEEKFNVSLEFEAVRPDYLGEVYSSILAGEPAGDIMQTYTSSHLLTLAAGGALYPLDEIVDESYWDELSPSYVQMKKYMQFDGNLYGIPDFTPIGAGSILIWNKDLFSNEGLPNLYNLTENKDWTWDKMRDIVSTLTKDTNGDGEIDQWGFGSSGWDLPVIASGLALLNNTSLTKEKDGKVVFNADSSEYINVLNFFSDIIENYWISEGHKDLFREQKVGLLAVPFGHVTNYINIAEEEGFNLGLAYLPLGPNGSEYFMTMRDHFSISIPVTVDNPKALIDLWISIVPPSTLNEMEEELILENAVDDDAYNMLKDLVSNYEMDSYLMPLFQQGFRGAINRIALEGESASTVMNEIKPEMQAVIDDLLKQN